jgi:hypothetical protein
VNQEILTAAQLTGWTVTHPRQLTREGCTIQFPIIRGKRVRVLRNNSLFGLITKAEVPAFLKGSAL